jgi:hypothetical protein
MQPTIVHKAIKMGVTKTPDLCLTASEEFPVFKSLEESRALFISEAESIFSALWHSLPGGTLDHLIAIMLEKKSSFFRVTRNQ